MLPKKHMSGAQKRNKRKREERFIESQKGAIHKFFSASSSVVPGDNPEEVDDTQDQEQESDHNLNAEVDVNEDATREQNLNAHVDANEDSAGEQSLQPSSENPNGNEQNDSLISIFDPRTWDNLDNNERDILIEKVPARELNLKLNREYHP